MKLYMAVTADKYELPLCVSEQALDVARYLGISRDRVVNLASKYKKDKETYNGRSRGYNIIKIEVEDEE